jgi:non-ribosomal peptide synthetase component F
VKVPQEIHVGAWLRKLQQQNLQQRQFEYTSLVQVQAWSSVPQNLPLFESLLVFENYPEEFDFQRGLSGLKLESFTTFERTNYPLTLVADPGEQLRLQINYDCQRFDADMIIRLGDHCRQLLQEIIKNVDYPLSTLTLLTMQEQALIRQWSQTQQQVEGDLSSLDQVKIRGSRVEQGEQYVPPRTPVEERLAEIWASVLQVERVGIYDDFFALGGHSLLATRIAARVRATFPVEIPLHTLLNTTTIADLADSIEQLIMEKLAELSDEEAQELLLNM